MGSGRPGLDLPSGLEFRPGGSRASLEAQISIPPPLPLWDTSLEAGIDAWRLRATPQGGLETSGEAGDIWPIGLIIYIYIYIYTWFRV